MPAINKVAHLTIYSQRVNKICKSSKLPSIGFVDFRITTSGNNSCIYNYLHLNTKAIP